MSEAANHILACVAEVDQQPLAANGAGEPERETADLLAQLWGTDPHETAFLLAECSLMGLARIESHEQLEVTKAKIGPLLQDTTIIDKVSRRGREPTKYRAWMADERTTPPTPERRR